MKNSYFPKAHLWLVIPFIITTAGFYWSYWSIFSQVPFRHHAHGLTATCWYLLLIIQPWLYNHKSLHAHRKVGFVGLFLAGGVVFSALQVIPYNIVSEFPPVLKYGLSFYDFAAIAGFSFSVIMAMMNSKTITKHSRWMIATIFWALQPAFLRLVYIPLNIITNGNSPLSFIEVLYVCIVITTIPLLIMIYIDYKNDKKFYLPNVLSLIGVPIITLLVEVMGNTTWWINWCDNVLAKGITS